MFCTHCGKKTPPDVKFCRHCGKRLTKLPWLKIALPIVVVIVIAGGIIFKDNLYTLLSSLKGKISDNPQTEQAITETTEEETITETTTLRLDDLPEINVRFPYFRNIEIKYLEQSEEVVSNFATDAYLTRLYVSVGDWENPDEVPFLSYTFFSPENEKSYQVSWSNANNKTIKEKQLIKPEILKLRQYELPPKLRVREAVTIAMQAFKKLFPEKEVKSFSASLISPDQTPLFGSNFKKEIWSITLNPKNPKPAEYYNFYATETLVIYKPKVKYSPKPN